MIKIILTCVVTLIIVLLCLEVIGAIKLNRKTVNIMLKSSIGVLLAVLILTTIVSLF